MIRWAYLVVVVVVVVVWCGGKGCGGGGLCGDLINSTNGPNYMVISDKLLFRLYKY